MKKEKNCHDFVNNLFAIKFLMSGLNPYLDGFTLMENKMTCTEHSSRS